jgi:hypothetical protein
MNNLYLSNVYTRRTNDDTTHAYSSLRPEGSRANMHL